MADGKEMILFQAGQDELTHDEIWDDTLLIQQYDEALAKVTLQLSKRTSVTNTTESEQSEASHTMRGGSQEHHNHDVFDTARKKKKRGKKKSKWHKGDYCRACYTEDGEWYEGTIIAISPYSCTVRYVGYNNEEEIPFNNLHKSKGEAARRRQLEAATCDAMSEVDQYSSVAESDLQSDTECENTTTKRHRQPPDHNATSHTSNMMPPPNHPLGPSGLTTPPPHLPLLPPPPALSLDISGDSKTSEALHTMLMSWYMTGYHTGYYQGIQQAQVKRRNR